MTVGNGTVLVTGATGFVGLAAVRGLLARGHRVCVFARGRSPGTAPLQELAQAGRVRTLWGDLTRSDLGLPKATLSELAREVTYVVHAAAHYRLSASRDEVWGANVDGLRNLLAHARHWPLAHFHHVSSITVAGDVNGEVPESPLPRPQRLRNAYEESKNASESMVLDWATVPLRVYRLGIVVGDSVTGAAQKFDGPYAAFGLMRRGLPFPIPGSGRNLFPLVTVDLTTDALVAGLDHEPDGCETLHVVDTDPPSVREFAEAMMERLAGHRGVLSVPERMFLAVTNVSAFERLSGLESAACEYMCAKSVFDLSAFAKFCALAGIRANRVKDAYDVIALYYATAMGRAFRPQDG